MRIDLYASTATALIQPAASSSVQKAANQKSHLAAQETLKEDTTTLSAGSDSVQSLTKAALETSPAVRAAKVAALKQAVNTSQYQLDSAKIAEAIFSADL